MIGLNVGNTWEHQLLDGIRGLHRIYDDRVRVTELYGSVAGDPVRSARGDHRLPQVDEPKIAEFITAAHRIGIQINYTINAPCIGGIGEFGERLPAVVAHLEALEAVGVDRLTVTHPLLMEMATQCTELPIEVSTICGVSSLSQIRAFAERFRIDKICMDIYRNRDVTFLREAQSLAGSLGVQLELIVNEFCSTGGAPCIYRQSCHNLHGHGGNPDQLLDNYPMARCVASRADGVAWLQGRFILPEDLDRYAAATGISHYKVTGRTHPTQILLRIAEYYVAGKSPANLLDLWVHVENIGRDPSDYLTQHAIEISTRRLVELDFASKWLTHSWRCSEHCGGTEAHCRYCHQILEQTQTHAGK